MLFAVEATVSGIGYLALALAVGALFAAGFLLSDRDGIMRRKLAAGALLFLGAVLVFGFLAVVVQGAKLSGGEWPSSDIVIRYLARTQSGKIWFAREIYALVLLVMGILLFRNKLTVGTLRLLFLLVLLLVATRGLTGHAVAARKNTPLLIGADAMHMLCVSLWAGGLPVLFWMLRSGARPKDQYAYWAANVVRRFSRVALISVCLLVASGLYQSIIHVSDFTTLLNTSYGNVLSFKLTLFGVMVALGTMNRFVTKPALLRAASPAAVSPRAARAYLPIGWEGALGLSVFMVTGFLTTLPPGVHRAHSVTQRQGASPFRQVHSHASGAVLAPAEGAAVKIIVPVAGQVFAGDQIPLRFALVEGKRGHHVHAYVDGELMGMFESDEGTLNGVEPGKHVLELRVVTADHQTELDARDRVDFIVNPK